MKITQSWQFDSIAAFAQAAGAAQPISGTAHEASEGPMGLYDYGMPFDDAVKTGLDGGYWREGAEHIAPVDLDLSDIQIMHDAMVPAWQMDIAGATPIVPVHLTGAPESMLSPTFEPKPTRIIRVGVMVGRSADVTQSQAFNRGNAILSIVNALELLGYRCEIWALWRNADCSYNPTKAVHVDVCIKNAQDFWDPAAVAFALANPAFQRRLVWHLIESGEDSNWICHQGYGIGTGADLSDFDLSFPFQTNQYPAGDSERAREQSIRRALHDTRKQLSNVNL